MEAIYHEKDVFVWLPTGYGKCLCYQALPFLLDCKHGLVESQVSSLVLVVSPLIVLMIDQNINAQSKHEVASCSIKLNR